MTSCQPSASYSSAREHGSPPGAQEARAGSGPRLAVAVQRFKNKPKRKSVKP